VLAGTSPAERSHVDNVDACSERRSGAEKACANAGGGQCSSNHTHRGRDSRTRSRKGKSSPVHAAYGLCLLRVGERLEDLGEVGLGELGGDVVSTIAASTIAINAS